MTKLGIAMHPFIDVIESMVTIPHLRDALIEATQVYLGNRTDGNINKIKRNRPVYFKRNADGSMTPEEMKARIEFYRAHKFLLGQAYDEQAILKDMKEHPEHFRKPLPTAPMKSMSQSASIVQEMNLPSQEEIRRRCYKETLFTIAKFYRSCNILDYDANEDLKKVLLADQEAEANGTVFHIDRNYPFPELDTIEKVFHSRLVNIIRKNNLPFNSCLTNVYTKAYKPMKEAEEKGEEAVKSLKYWNYISTAPAPDRK